MFQKLTHTLLFLLAATPLFAQSDWIKPGQRYFKIPVYQTGTYQIRKAELQKLHIPVDSISPNAFQIFRRGKQIPLKCEKGNLVFNARKNEGEGDSALYIHAAAIPKTRYSLYSDTAAYFLTWQNDFFEHDNTTRKAAGYQALDFQMEEIVHSYHSHYNPGAFYPPGSGFEDGSALSDYDEGEGWTGPEIKAGDSVQIVFETKIPEAARNSHITLEIAITGWQPGLHDFEVHSMHADSKLGGLHFEGYQSESAVFPIAANDFNEAGEIKIHVKPIVDHAQAALTYARLTFPKSDNLPQEELLQVSAINPVTFPEIDTTAFDYLIITHAALLNAAKTYAAYRTSSEGGGFKTRIALISDLFNRFNFGDPSPAAIRKAIEHFYQNNQIKFVFLIGASVDPQKARKLKSAQSPDLIPNAGWPGSDVALAMQPGSISPPLVAIGRLNASSPQQVFDYLAKVKAMEAEPKSESWRRRVLHLSGGRSRDELNAFKGYVKDFEQILSTSNLNTQVETFSKETDAAVEHIPLAQPVNEGAALVTLFGHSGTNATDLDIGFASSPEQNYANHPRYPAVIVNGCASGSIFYTPKTLSSDWIFTPNAGAVLFLAHTSNGVSTALKRYTSIFYEVLADSAFSNQPFGLIQQEAIRRNLSRNPAIYDRITVQQMNLHGDPAIIIFPKTDHIDSIGTEKPQMLPVATITVDGRLLQNGEFVSSKPTLSMHLIEPAAKRNSGDTTGIHFWLKPVCDGCREYRLSLYQARWKSTSEYSWQINLPFEKALSPGKYQLTAQARDLHRNIVPTYQITFEVSDTVAIRAFDVFPNPSAKWFLFAFNMSSLPPLSNATLHLYDPAGRNIFTTHFPVHAGVNQYYWQPESLASGFYLYKITVFTQKQPGNAAHETVLKGRLLWTP